MDFNELIHKLRGELIRQMPKGADVVLSAGCSGAWYFKWFEENYGPVKKHIGLELYSERPDDLPSNVEWIENSVDEMFDVESDSVDLLFSGQNVEHLNPQVLFRFLRESNRVIRQGGYLVIDSPNRKITVANRYVQPEHILELTDDEILDLLNLAGFHVESIKGVWNCRRTSLNSYAEVGISAPADNAELDMRSRSALNDPGGSFIWWAVAKKKGPVQNSLERKIGDIYLKDFPGFVRTRFSSQVGKLEYTCGTEVIISTTKKDFGYVFYGPYIPLFPGEYMVYFRYKCLKLKGSIIFDIISNLGQDIYARSKVSATSMSTDWAITALRFKIHSYVTGLETRVLVAGVDANFKFGSEIIKIG